MDEMGGKGRAPLSAAAPAHGQTGLLQNRRVYRAQQPSPERRLTTSHPPDSIRRSRPRWQAKELHAPRPPLHSSAPRLHPQGKRRILRAFQGKGYILRMFRTDREPRPQVGNEDRRVQMTQAAPPTT